MSPANPLTSTLRQRLTLLLRPSFPISPSASIRPLARPFHISGAKAALNESDRDRDPATLASEIDQHKTDLLAKHKSGKPAWKGELASQSEAAVQADRDGSDVSSEDEIKKLQRETVETVGKGEGKGEGKGKE